MHYIYHIPERDKIGVTTDLVRRMKEHKWTNDYEVLEEHLDGWHAGDREWELQDQYGYPRDKNHYMVSVMNASKGGKAGCIASVLKNPNHMRDMNAAKTKHDHPKLAARRLTTSQVKRIRALHATGNYTLAQLAEPHELSSSTIFNIVHKKSYKEIE